MAFPKLTWPASTEANAFTFKYPPRRQSSIIQKASRHDNTSSYGIRESIYERSETFANIEMDTVLSGTDVTNWQTFMAYALQGGQFYYYLDASLPAKTAYTLEGTDFDAAWKSVGMYTFKLVFRAVIT